MSGPSDKQPEPSAGTPGAVELTRRGFLRKGAVAATGAAAVAAALSPLRGISPEDVPSLERLLQKHYKEMSADEMKAVLDRIAREVEKRYAVHPRVTDVKPMTGIEFVYALNISRCIGCRRCVHACV